MKLIDKAEKISITLPPDMLNIIREKVKDGAYASQARLFVKRCDYGKGGKKNITRELFPFRRGWSNRHTVVNPSCWMRRLKS